MEILQQEHIVKTRTMPVLDLEFLKHKVMFICLVLYVIINVILFFQKPSTENKDENNTEETSAKLESAKTPKETKKVLTSSAPPTLPGHTGYLTFATLPPAFVR